MQFSWMRWLCGAGALLWVCASRATPQVLRVDGAIFDADGLPLTVNRDVQIRAFDAATGGTALWSSVVQNVPVAAGRFSLLLDAAAGSSPSLLERISERSSSQGIYFQIEVDSGAANGTMDSAQIVLPRLRARGTTYALSAARADSLRGVTVSVAEMNYLSGLTANVQTQLANAGGGALSLLKAGQITATSRALPTSGSLSGTYIQFGGVTSTGTYSVAPGTRIYIRGNFVLGHNFTVSGEAIGGQSDNYGNAQDGGGPAGGTQNTPYSAGSGGGGGGFGGSGGKGGSYTGGGYGWGGRAMSWQTIFAGSGGASGAGYSTSDNAGDGGDAGGVVYLEAQGNVMIGASSTVSAIGGAGTNAVANYNYIGGGGGGSGGGIMVRASGDITVGAGTTISVKGGAGGTGYSYGGGGGGGGGGVIQLWSGGTLTNSGLMDIGGGAKGAGGGSHATEAVAGMAGITSMISASAPISFY